MFRVPIDEVAEWLPLETEDGSAKAYFPADVVVPCPHCHRSSPFALDRRIGQENLFSGTPLEATCRLCNLSVRFIILDPNDEDGPAWTGEIWMHPAPEVFDPLPLEDLLTEREYDAYLAAHRQYGFQEWSATVHATRRCLEAIVKKLLREQEIAYPGFSLGKAIGLLPDDLLNEPVRLLAEALQKLGNLGSHFDEEIEVDESLASDSLRLLDEFVNYLFVLRERVGSARVHLSRAEDEADPGTDPSEDTEDSPPS